MRQPGRHRTWRAAGNALRRRGGCGDEPGDLLGSRFDRIIGLLDSRRRRAENGQSLEKQLLLTRFDAQRSNRGEMLSVEDMLEILSIPLLGIIPESDEILRASNLGRADHDERGRARRAAPTMRRRVGWPGKMFRWLCRPKEDVLKSLVRSEGGMNLFGLFKAHATAPVARERLQILLAHERVAVGPGDLVAVLRDELIATIARHVEIDPEKVMVRMDRAGAVSMLEIDVEIPSEKIAKRNNAMRATARGLAHIPEKCVRFSDFRICVKTKDES